MIPTQGPFPATRFRRTRQSKAVRGLVRQNFLSPADLIWPIFLTEGNGVTDPVPSMPGVARLSVDLAVSAARRAQSLGIPAICLFPYTEADRKTETCEEAWNPENLSNRATRAIKDAVAYENRLAVIEALWQVVLADGSRSDEENALLRLVASLLGITDTDSAMARKRIENAPN